MEKKEMKKKSKKSIVAIIIVLLAVAGFGVYKYVIVPNTVDKYDIPEASTETVETKEVLTYEDGFFPPVVEDICGIMEGSEATYFYAEYDPSVPTCTVTQMSKEDFNKIHTAEETSSISKRACKFMNYFFSLEHNGMPNDPLGNNATNVFGVNAVGIDEEIIAPHINNMFGGSFVGYYKDHELKVSCDNTKITKFCYVHEVSGQDPNAFDRYIVITDSEVTTDKAVGDMSDIGIFANAGESKKLTTRMSFFPSKGMSKVEMFEFEIR